MVGNGCIVCNEAEARVSGASDNYNIECPYCGEYTISASAYATLAHRPLLESRQIANARGWLRENNRAKLLSDDVEFLRTIQTPTVAQRAQKLLVAIHKRDRSISATTSITRQRAGGAYWIVASWSVNDGKELFYLLDQYMSQTMGWLFIQQTTNSLSVQISPAGHDFLENFQSNNSGAASGFCAMWFSPEVTPLWTDGIGPAINAAGYDAVRIDGVEHNNKIDDEILANIRASRFVVADFTGGRGGVYFEAGFAMGLGIPVIWTVREDVLSTIHFDNRQYNFLQWKPEALSEFTERLRLRIEATIGRGPRKF